MYARRASQLAVLLDELGSRPGQSFAGSFDERLVGQKTVYLLQEALATQGLGGMGYGFSWYIRGPYSSAAAEDLFLIADEEFRAPRGLALTEQGRQAVATVAPLLRPPPTSGMSRPQWLELVASLHYLARHLDVPADFPAAWEELRRNKPYLASREQTQLAWEALSRSGMVGGN